MSVEFVAYAIGHRTDKIDTLVIPQVLGICSEDRDLLDRFMGTHLSTEARLAVSGEAPDETACSIMLTASPEGRDEETSAFFDESVLVTPQGVGLSVFMSDQMRAEHFPSEAASQIDARRLADLVRKAGMQTRIKNRPYTYLPTPLEIGQFGARHAYWMHNTAVQETLSANQYIDYGDIHIHESLTMESADEGQKALMSALGKDYFRLPSEYDILSMLSSEANMEALGLPGRTRSAFKGILATTPHMDPAKRDKLGASYFDFASVSEHQPTLKRVMETTNRATSSLRLQDRIEFFELMKELTTETAPCYVDTT